jgi:hypothetical protein
MLRRPRTSGSGKAAHQDNDGRRYFVNIDWTTITTAIVITILKPILNAVIDWIAGKIKSKKKYVTKKDSMKPSGFDIRPAAGLIAVFMISYLLIDSIRSSEPLTRGAVFEIALFTFALGILILYKPKV